MSAHPHRSTRRTLLGLIGAAVLYPRAGRAEPLASDGGRAFGTASEPGFGTISGRAFGTTWRVVGASDAGLEGMGPRIAALFDEIDRQMSPWRADSAISRFNAAPAGGYAADEDLLHVTRGALALADRSRGAFDPSVGPLVARWGFGPIEGGAPDWRGLSVGAGRIEKTRDDLTLDLCGIAKGRALDRAVDLLADAGHDSLLFDLGGELRALGRHPSGRAWRVAVRHPEAEQPAPAHLRLPAGRSVATTGTREQSYALGGRTYGHIIDPARRAPVSDMLGSVTVVADDAMAADGWATALFAAGATAGVTLAREQGISALFLIRSGAGLRQVATGGMQDLVL